MALADVPVHCLRGDAIGKWTFHVGDWISQKVTDPFCGYSAPDTPFGKNRVFQTVPFPPDSPFKPTSSFDIILKDDYSAELISSDESIILPDGNRVPSDSISARWTMVYDEGFNVEIKHESNSHNFFAFFKYAEDPKSISNAGNLHRNAEQIAIETKFDSQKVKTAQSFCWATLIGWYSQTTPTGGAHARKCYYATRSDLTEEDVVNIPHNIVNIPPSSSKLRAFINSVITRQTLKSFQKTTKKEFDSLDEPVTIQPHAFVELETLDNSSVSLSSAITMTELLAMLEEDSFSENLSETANLPTVVEIIHPKLKRGQDEASFLGSMDQIRFDLDSTSKLQTSLLSSADDLKLSELSKSPLVSARSLSPIAEEPNSNLIKSFFYNGYGKLISIALDNDKAIAELMQEKEEIERLESLTKQITELNEYRRKNPKIEMDTNAPLGATKLTDIDVKVLSIRSFNWLNKHDVLDWLKAKTNDHQMAKELIDQINMVDPPVCPKPKASADHKQAVVEDDDYMKETKKHALSSLSFLEKYGDVLVSHPNLSIVPGVLNQGHCGSCYAVATAQMITARLRIQALLAILLGKTDITPQELEFLLDDSRFTVSHEWPAKCSGMNQGCEGGYPFLANKVFHENHGVSQQCMDDIVDELIATKSPGVNAKMKSFPHGSKPTIDSAQRIIPQVCAALNGQVDAEYARLSHDDLYFEKLGVSSEELFSTENINHILETARNLPSCKFRVGVESFGYAGGSYGATDELSLMLSLYLHGPIVASLAPDREGVFSSYTQDVVTGSPSSVQSKLSTAESQKLASKIQNSPNYLQEISDKYLAPALSWHKVDHSTLLVGWGEDDKFGPYWIVQNSWGKEWGREGGFLRISRGRQAFAIESIGVHSVPTLLRM